MTTAAEAHRRRSERLAARAWRHAAPIYDAALRDPVRSGRFRLDGVGGLERYLAALGLVALGGLLASLLLGDVWRRTRLLFLTDLEGHATFVPTIVYPLTLLGLALAFLLLLWGATWVSIPARVAVVAVFLVVCSPLSSPLEIGQGRFLYRAGPTAAEVAFWALAGLVLATIVLFRRPAWEQRLRPVLFGLIVAALVVLFGVQEALYVNHVDDGLPASGPGLLDGTLRGVQSLLVPMVYVSALALVVFAFDVAGGAAAAVSELGARVAKLALFGLLALKLWLLLTPIGELADFLETSPRSAVRVVLAVAFFGAVAYAIRRWARSREAPAAAQEGLMHVASFAAATPLLVNLVVVAFAQLLVVQFRALGAAGWFTRTFPFDFLADEGLLIVALAILAAGAALLVLRPRGSVAHETGIGLALVGAWSVSIQVLVQLDVDAGFRDSFFDLVATGAIAVYALVRARSLSGPEAVALFALAVFLWLVTLRGDVVAFAGQWFGLPAVVVVVLGVVWTLLSSSAFVAGDSAGYPRRGRALLWLGYLLLAASVLLWVDVTHSSDITSDFTNVALLQLGTPLAVWLWLRRSFDHVARQTA